MIESLTLRTAIVTSKNHKIRWKIRTKFDHTAVQGHPRSSILCQSKAHMWLPISH